MTPREFGKHLSSIRESVGMTMSEAGRAAGWSASRIWQLENGWRDTFPTVKTLTKLGRVYGVSLSQMVPSERK